MNKEADKNNIMSNICYIKADNISQILNGLKQLSHMMPKSFTKRISNLAQYAEKLYKYAQCDIAYLDNKPIGMCAYFANRKDYAYLPIIIVNETMQGKGVGTFLLRQAEAFALEKNLHLLILEVDNDNIQAQSFYLANGYKLSPLPGLCYTHHLEKQLKPFEWEKRGVVFNPTRNIERPSWRWNYAQGVNTLELNDRIRTYFCCREKPDELGRTVSRVSYVDLDKENPMHIIKVADHPCFNVGALGTFDEFGTYPFSVIRSNNIIYGYYGGVTRCESVPFNVAIGCVLSKDGGNTFQRLGPGPILGYSPDEPFVVCSPKVRIFNGKWYMFYSAGREWVKGENRPEIYYKLRLATSNDGINWTRENRDIISDCLGTTEAQACGDVTYSNGLYHMFFCYRKARNFRRDRHNSYRIGYAFSTDLLHWRRCDCKAGISPSDDIIEWDAEMVTYPHIFSAANKIWMLYLGNEVGKYGFGLAELRGKLQ